MLEEFVDLQPGDVVVQNAANSAVGQYVIQMARNKGLRTVNIVRPRCVLLQVSWHMLSSKIFRLRPDMQATVDVLKTLGADMVTTDAALRQDFGVLLCCFCSLDLLLLAHRLVCATHTTIAFSAAASGLPAPRLALNAVGGASATALAKCLACVALLCVCLGGRSQCCAFLQAGRRVGDVWRDVAAAGEHPYEPADLQGPDLPGVLAEQPSQRGQPLGHDRACGGHVPDRAPAALQVDGAVLCVLVCGASTSMSTGPGTWRWRTLKTPSTCTTMDLEEQNWCLRPIQI